jgi:RimJ/RimL family protein N-acetyltransferase
MSTATQAATRLGRPEPRAEVPRGVPGLREPLELSLPGDGLRDDDIVLRLPSADDIDELAPAFADPDLREAGNLPELDRDEILATLPYLPALAADGRLLPVVVAEAPRGDVLGGAALHHLDAERGIVELGYWLFPHARGRGLVSSAWRRTSTSATAPRSACSSAPASAAKA